MPILKIIFALTLVVLTNCQNVTVSNAAQLTAALANAKPGHVITMADGVYTAPKIKIGLYSTIFGSSVSGTKTLPIVLKGSSKAIIDGGDFEGYYGFYLCNVSYWQVRGITVRNAEKGIVLDRSNNCLIDSVRVHTIGQEAIHLRAFSSDNTVSNSLVEGTGLKSAGYGEGLYIGSAKSNWATYSGGNPDKSDRNRIVGNTIRNTTAENIDIKEGTTGGFILNNTFNGIGMSGDNYADSWIDVKGNNYTISCNTGVLALLDGFQVHSALTGWGYYNQFHYNKLEVNSTGYGFTVQSSAKGNIIACDNTVTKAGSGFADVSCVNKAATPCTSPVTTVCTSAAETKNVTLSCSTGTISVTAAYYGTPTSCPNPVASSCNSSTATSVVQSKCNGKTSCTVLAGNANFGDPCSGITKKLVVTYTCK